MTATGNTLIHPSNNNLTQWANMAHTSLLHMRNQIDILLDGFKVLSQSNAPSLVGRSSTDAFLRSLDVPQAFAIGSSTGSDTTDNSASHQNGGSSSSGGRLLSMPHLDRDMSWGSVGGMIGRSNSQMDILANAAASPSANATLMRQTSFDRSVASILVDEKHQRGGSVGLFSQHNADETGTETGQI